MAKPTVGIHRCSIDSTPEQVEEIVRATVELAGGVPRKVREARKIVVKPNYVGIYVRPAGERPRRYRDRPIGCVDDMVVRAALSMLREANPSAEIILAEGLDAKPSQTSEQLFSEMRCDDFPDLFGVKLMDANLGDFVQVPIPGGGLLYDSIYLRRELADADAVVSLAKLKVHSSAGITMSVKNMFGIVPRSQYGGAHRGFMHTNHFRLMRIFVDVATAMKPDLAILDGIIASNMSLDGDPVETELMLAGHDPVATDAIGTRIIGFDPLSDFPTKPWLRAENHLRLASQAGLGVLDPAEIDVRGLNVEDNRWLFDLNQADGMTSEQAHASRLAVRREARAYLTNRDRLVDEYRDRYIFLRNGEVEWSETTRAAATERARASDGPEGFGLILHVSPADSYEESIEAYLD
jgi:uncharacterized protein (DUF362 family)